MKNKKILIVGAGSIGKRHAKVFSELKAEVGIVSRRNIEWDLSFRDLKTGVVTFKPEIVLIASKTSEHKDSLDLLEEMNFNGSIYIEKPLFNKMPSNNYQLSENTYITYNLRFHPVVKFLKEELKNKEIINADIYCGQYLPEWRPDSDYRLSYSASKKEGGGVLRDLSHELDYAYLLFGKVKKLSSLGGKKSNLEIDSEDIVTSLMETERCSVLSLSVNYLDKITQRKMRVITNEATYDVDFLTSKIIKNQKIIMNKGICSSTYHDQAQAILDGDNGEMCSFEEGIYLLSLIEAIEKSISGQGVVSL